MVNFLSFAASGRGLFDTSPHSLLGAGGPMAGKNFHVFLFFFFLGGGGGGVSMPPP